MTGREFGKTKCGRGLRLGLAALAMGVAAIGAQGAVAQDIAGTWQGTMQVNGGARVVLKVTKAEAPAGWKAVLYSIDETDAGRAANSISLQAGMVKLAIVSVDFSYEGKLSADGASIEGSAKLGGQTYPLNFA
ncbi:MAG TPA: hypothetical protein VGN01_14195, partial [Acidobacteriaceae bacterium]